MEENMCYLLEEAGKKTHTSLHLFAVALLPGYVSGKFN